MTIKIRPTSDWVNGPIESLYTAGTVTCGTVVSAVYAHCGDHDRASTANTPIGLRYLGAL